MELELKNQRRLIGLASNRFGFRKQLSYAKKNATQREEKSSAEIYYAEKMREKEDRRKWDLARLDW